MFILLILDSQSLNFLIERTITNKINELNTENFTTIFNSFGKRKNVPCPKGLKKLFLNYIEQYINKFEFPQLISVVITFPKVIDNFSKDNLSLLYMQLSGHFQKINANKLVHLFFIFYCGKIRLNYSEKEVESFLQCFIDKQSELNSKSAYLLSLTYHFNPELNLANNLMRDLLMEVFERNITYFLPNELNSLITMYTNNPKFATLNIAHLIKLYFNSINTDYKEMNIDELLLYLDTLIFTISPVPQFHIESNKFRELLEDELINQTKELKLEHLIILLDLIDKKSVLNKGLDISFVTDIILNLSEKRSLTINECLYITELLFERNDIKVVFWKEFSRNITLLDFMSNPEIKEKIDKKLNLLLLI